MAQRLVDRGFAQPRFGRKPGAYSCSLVRWLITRVTFRSPGARRYLRCAPVRALRAARAHGGPRPHQPVAGVRGRPVAPGPGARGRPDLPRPARDVPPRLRLAPTPAAADAGDARSAGQGAHCRPAGTGQNRPPVQPDRGRIDTADHECHDQPVRHQPRRPHVLLPPGNAADVLAAGAQVRGRVVRRRVEIVLVDAGLEAIRLRS